MILADHPTMKVSSLLSQKDKSPEKVEYDQMRNCNPCNLQQLVICSEEGGIVGNESVTEISSLLKLV